MGSGTRVPGSGPGVRDPVSGSGIEASPPPKPRPRERRPRPVQPRRAAASHRPWLVRQRQAWERQTHRIFQRRQQNRPGLASRPEGGRALPGLIYFRRRGALARGLTGPAGGGVAVVTARAWVAAVGRL